MKVTITREELRQVLTGYFRTEVEDFIIVATKPSEIGEKIRNVVLQPEASVLKMANAKSLRNLAVDLGKPMNLLDTKWALENWSKFIEFVDTYNRLPSGGFGSEERMGVLQ
jgi:hypothetical protein